MTYKTNYRQRPGTISFALAVLFIAGFVTETDAEVPVVFPVPDDVKWITPPDFGPLKHPALKWGDTSMTGRSFSKDPDVIRFQGRYLMYFSMPPTILLVVFPAFMKYCAGRDC